MKTRLLILAILLSPLLLYVPDLAKYPFPLTSQYSDLLISHLPNAVYLQHSLLAHGQIPLWSDAILGGYPFFADPLSGLWYPTSWLLILSPDALGFNTLILVHMLWGGIGMYLFLRSQTFNSFASLAGSLLFELFPKAFAHYAAGHVTLIFAYTWIPWLLFFERRRNEPRHQKSFAPALIFSLIILADVRLAVFAGLLWAAYSFRLTLQSQAYSRWTGVFRTCGKWAIRFLPQGIASLAIASPFLIPFFQFTHFSTRSMLDTGENLILSMNPMNLVGLIYPNIGQYAEWVIYPGILGFFSILWLLGNQNHLKEHLFWIIVFLISLVWAMGENIPGLGTVASLPGLNLLRVPSRIIFLTSLPISIFIAAACSQFINEKMEDNRHLSNLLVSLAGFFIILFACGVWVINKSLPFNFLWGAALAVVFCLLYILRTKNIISGRVWSIISLPIMVLDLSLVNSAGIRYQTQSEIFDFPPGILSLFEDEKQPFRIYSPSYALPQHIAAINRLEQVDGINPLQLSAIVNFMQGASGVPAQGYSVTLPPFASGNPSTDNAGYFPNAKELGLLNVKYILSSFELNAGGISRIDGFDSPFLYENQSYLPRAWVQPSSSNPGEGILSQARILTRSPNQIELAAEGPGILVASEILYPGWEVLVDGKRSIVEPIGDVLIGVALSEGVHSILLSFNPIIQYWGIALCGIAIILLVFNHLRNRHRVS